MDFIVKDIPKIGRGKYNSTTISTIQNVGGSSSSGNRGLPYTMDIDGNYIIENNIIIKGNVVSQGDVVAYGRGTDEPNSNPVTTLWELDDVSDEVFDAADGDTLYKEGGIWISKKHDFYRRALTDSTGRIIESPEEYKLRVGKDYRYTGMDVVLRTNPDDTTYTRYSFKNGIEDYDLVPVDYFLGIEAYIEDNFYSYAIDKALSANKGRELYNLIININGGVY